jgi:signal transduction histidine kinase/ActR/RegA family two-component response regulator
MRPRSIRSHLFQVLLACVLPLGVFAAVLLYLHWQAQERERERAQIESVRLLAAAVDNALDSTVQRLSILARLWASNPASDKAVYQQAREALGVNPDWSNIVAFRADGSGVFRANEPFDADLSGMQLLPLWRPVLDERKTVVSDVYVSTYTGEKTVAVGVPVIMDGKATHVLAASLNLRWFDQLMARQGRSGLAGVFDRTWQFVARTTEGDQRRGTDGAPALIEDMKRRPEGIGRYDSLSGAGVYTSWTATRHGWWVALATPAGPIESAFWTYLGALGLLWAAMLAAGIAYAVHKGRRIATGLDALKGGAAELAAARRLRPLPAAHVQEVDDALAALQRASERLQDAMRERDASLEVEQKARAAAEAANRAKDEFLAMLGHELRNPLAAIWNASTVMRSQALSAEQLDFATSVIERQSRHLKRLIDDLLDVGRVMTGKVMLERGPLDLGAAVRHVAASLETAGRFAQRRVEIDAAPVWIDGDPTRIEQIATNLLANALTYTPAGGRVRVRVAREGDHALLEVSDDGRGIAPGDLERVFDLFYQADLTPDRATGGLGIGLTLVRRLVELHGGTVAARSDGKGKGASFSVRLPAMPAEPRVARAEAPERAGARHTILIVEDNADERESLRTMLELHGHTVLYAADGPSALELLRRKRPPVAILDIGLPGMDGYDVARAARAELGGGIFLIALTGYGGNADAQRAREAGFDVHLTKPVELHELARVIANQGALSADQKIA